VFGIFNFLIFLVLAIYLLIYFHVFIDTCYSYIPETLKADTLRIARRLDVDLMAFFRGQLTVAGSVTVLYLIGLLIAGIPFALPVAVIAGVGNMIPYMGTFIGMTLGLIASVIGYGLDIHLLYVVLVFIIAQSIDGLFITPTLIGKNVGFNPVIVILSLLVFGKLLGFFGVLLAIPLTSVTRIILLEIYDRIEFKGKVEKTATDVIVPPGPEKKKSEQ
jgi:predicted PurR-regulated permease PerM